MSQIILDPAPEEWLTEERLKSLKSEINTCLPLLRRADVLKQVLSCWVRMELGDVEANSTASLSWAKEQWGHRIDSLFLQSKDELDQASCRLLRVNQQGLALELYHRLLAEEASFEELSRQFGVGKERFNGGLLKRQSLSRFPEDLGRLLRTLQPGQLSKPLRMGKNFGVVQLEEYLPAVLGDESADLLLKEELRKWTEAVAQYLVSLVSLSE